MACFKAVLNNNLLHSSRPLPVQVVAVREAAWQAPLLLLLPPLCALLIALPAALLHMPHTLSVIPGKPSHKQAEALALSYTGRCFSPLIQRPRLYPSRTQPDALSLSCTDVLVLSFTGRCFSPLIHWPML